MTTTINASTSAGLVQTADTSGLLALQTANTTALTVDGSQNIGIGTTSPSNRLSVVTASGSDGFISVSSPTTDTAGVSINGGTSSNKGAIVRFQKNASTKWTMGTDSAIIGSTSDNFHLYGGGADAMLFSTNATERMRINSSGDVGIGTSSPANYGAGYTTLKLNGSTSGVFDISTNNTRVLSAYYDSPTSAPWLTSITAVPLVFGTNGVERMRIASSGTVGIGQSADAYSQFQVKFDATNSTNNYLGIGVSPAANTSGAVFVRFYNATGNGCGDITRVGTTNAVTYGTTSDYRLKENVQSMTGALDKVALLNPVTYIWKDCKEPAEGFIAHELQEVIPTAVSGQKDGVDEQGNPKYQNVDASYVVATLTAAIQELKAINDTQAETINALTARIVALEGV